MSAPSPRYHLDPAGDVDQTGLQNVYTEAEFLRQALLGKPLLIHGPPLVEWAQKFAIGRNFHSQKVYSARTTLEHLVPGLGAESAQVLLEHWPELGIDFNTRSHLPKLIAHLAGGQPLGSAEHAAEWLLLRSEATPELQLALERVGASASDMVSTVWTPIYGVSEEGVEPLLLSWLGIQSELPRWPAPFPLPLRGQALEMVRQHVAKAVSEQGLDAFSQWQADNAAVEILKVAAVETAAWLKLHPEALTQTAIRRLREFLPNDRYGKLVQELPVHFPAPLPEHLDAWPNWMEREYLPYRTSKKADQLALLPTLRHFAERFLTVYAKALNAGSHADWLVWQRSADLKRSDRLTLVVICDGLSLHDLAILQRHLAQHDSGQRLSDLGSQVAFPALPTITHQAKPALVCGVAPTLSDKGKPLGESSTRESKVRAALQNGRPGDIVFWNYVQTDKLYHDADTLDEAFTAANATLMGLAERLLGLMLDGIPNEVPAQLVITTDHGRLLLESERTVSAPHHFKPEGRAAFGIWASIPAQGFELGETYALLGRTTFGMTQDAAVMWGDQTFRTITGATGREVCPHGGITPEEVLIPWAVYVRDLDFRLPSIEVAGKGEAEQPGVVVLRGINSTDLTLTVSSTTGSLVALIGDFIGWTLPPHSVTERQLTVTAWPKSETLGALYLKLGVQAGQGAVQYVDAQIALESEELYTPTTSILDDLL